jgi:hypothetical protein
VVNDLGGSFKGEGAGTKAADIVVDGMSVYVVETELTDLA